MTKIQELGKGYVGRLMIGQAMVFRVAAELLLRGHVPSFPSVDSGVDILIDNGLRIQVKGRTLTMGHPNYPGGVYNFSTKENNRQGKWGERKRDWSKVCDFIIYVGINEGRYFIVPSARHGVSFWIRPKGSTEYCVSVDAMRALREKGMSFQAVADNLGVSEMTVLRNLRKPTRNNSPGGNRYLASFEDQWDLLDVNRVVNAIDTADVDAANKETNLA